jgi:hypothetical protein
MAGEEVEQMSHQMTVKAEAEEVMEMVILVMEKKKDQTKAK